MRFSTWMCAHACTKESHMRYTSVKNKVSFTPENATRTRSNKGQQERNKKRARKRDANTMVEISIQKTWECSCCICICKNASFDLHIGYTCNKYWRVRYWILVESWKGNVSDLNKWESLTFSSWSYVREIDSPSFVNSRGKSEISIPISNSWCWYTSRDCIWSVLLSSLEMKRKEKVKSHLWQTTRCFVDLYLFFLTFYGTTKVSSGSRQFSRTASERFF